jgi:hypothetical protein
MTAAALVDNALAVELEYLPAALLNIVVFIPGPAPTATCEWCLDESHGEREPSPDDAELTIQSTAPWGARYDTHVCYLHWRDEICDKDRAGWTDVTVIIPRRSAATGGAR